MDKAQKKHGLFLLKEASTSTKKHLLSESGHNWLSGFLEKDDILEIEKTTGRKIQIEISSGEHFYKLLK